MASGYKDLTVASIRRGVFTLAVPLACSGLLQILFNMSDLAVVGQFSGSRALGAVGSTTMLVTLFTEFLLGLGSGINAVAGRYFGQKDERRIAETVHTSMVISLIVGILIMLIGELTAVPVLTLLGTKEELFDGAVRYLRYYYLGMPALAVYNFSNGIYSASGNTRKPLVFLTAAGILNVLLNLFFVIVCNMDVVGVALASTLSQYVSGLGIMGALMRENGPQRLNIKKLALSRKLTPLILKMGLISGLQFAIFYLGNLFIQYGVNTLDSAVVAANAAASNADTIVYNVMYAFYGAGASFIAQNYGSGNMKRVKESYLTEVAYGFAAGAVLGGLFILFGRPFLRIFTPEEAVIQAGMQRMLIMGLSYAFSSLMDGSLAACRSLGESVVPTIIVVLGACVFRIIWIFTVFQHFHSIYGLYSLYIFSWLLTAAAEILYFIKIYRRNSKIFS